MSKPRSIYLAFTAYHVVVAIGLAWMKRRHSAGTLIVAPNFAGSQALACAVRDQCGMLFDQVMHADFDRSDIRPWTRFFLRRQFYRSLTRQLRRQPVDEVLTAKSRAPITHQVLSRAWRFHPILSVALFEDGVSLYMDSPQTGQAHKARRAAIDKIYARFPDLIPPEKRRSRQIVEFRPEKALDAIYRNLESALFPDLIRRYGSSRWDILLLLPKISEAVHDPAVEPYFQALCRWTQRHGLTLIKKYHPKDHAESDAWNQLFARSETLPNTVPIEFVYAGLPDSFRCVIGFSSAGLVTALSMLRGAKAISFSANNRGNSSLHRLFASVGIPEIDDPEATESMLDRVLFGFHQSSVDAPALA